MSHFQSVNCTISRPGSVHIVLPWSVHKFVPILRPGTYAQISILECVHGAEFMLHVHVLKSWKSYRRLANQIPGLEKLWKNAILIRCPGNVLEFILGTSKYVKEVKTSSRVLSIWGGRAGNNKKKYGPKILISWKVWQQPLNEANLRRNVVHVDLDLQSFRKNLNCKIWKHVLELSWKCPEILVRWKCTNHLHKCVETTLFPGYWQFLYAYILIARQENCLRLQLSLIWLQLYLTDLPLTWLWLDLTLLDTDVILTWWCYLPMT